MNTRFMNALLRHPNRYPSQLDEHHPRILERIAQLWGTGQLELYLQELLIDSRGGRRGFAPEVMRDLMFLHGLHQDVRHKAPAPADAQGHDRVRKSLVQQEKLDPAQLLNRAVREGNENVVRLLLGEGVDVRKRNANGWTPLMVASFVGNRQVATLLIEAGAHVNAQDARGYAPLHWAAFKNFHEVVHLLLRQGALVNIPSASGMTPLMQASARGALESMQLLLRFGADVNQADHEGWTPLHKAVASDSLKAVELLVDEGADWQATHRSGVTPVVLARRKPQFAPMLAQAVA